MERALLEHYIGRSGFLKIMDVLMKHPSTDYSKKEIAEAAGISESTLHRNWEEVEVLELVEPTRKYGKAQLYRLNQSSEIVKKLFALDQEVRRKHQEREKVKA
ncbi:MAG: hypothetical protein SVV03_01755 [Candidatus Nanohaloarchaea archaeon]|nr:hypothetical protein [Candidatus Nanohaloarchaea archaeon]